MIDRQRPPRNTPSRVTPAHVRVKGRARLRVLGLRRSPVLRQRVEHTLLKLPGVTSAQANLLTGNVLVCFDEELTLTRIIGTLEGALGAAPGAGPNHESIREPVLPEALRSLIARLSQGFDAGSVEPPAGAEQAAGENPAAKSWHSHEAAHVLASLETSAASGLAGTEARRRLSRYGVNALPRPRPRSNLSLLLSQVATPPVALLGASAVVAVLTGGILDAAAILAVVIINAAIGFYTEEQAERIISSLDQGPPRTANVLRDGRSRRASAENVVPGDMLLLGPGSYVAADARIVQADRLSLDESSLTGESMPVLKDAAAVVPEDTPLADRANMVYTGTVVTGGSGTAAVVATGRMTELGQIQAMLGEAKPPETPMERQLGQLGGQLALLSGAVCGAVFAVGLLRGYGWLQMLKASISLAVAAVPEGLPTVATTTLALGIREMRRRKVLIRKLDAVEGLGSVQVFCLDKTGTLTMNRMAVVALHAGMERISLEGDRFLASGAHIEPSERKELRRLAESVALCSEVQLNGESSDVALDGSPTETALLELSISAGVDVAGLRRRKPVLAVEQRSESRHYMRSIHRRRKEGCFVAVKGNPSQVLALCRWYMAKGKRYVLKDKHRKAILAENDAMAGDALRVLGVAFGVAKSGSDLEKQELVWLGLAGMADPIRPRMAWLLRRFHAAGIDTVMITGDQSATAYAVGKQLELSNGRPLEILDSASLDKTDPDMLAGVIRRVDVFSRVSPAHKLKIVQALQRAGLVVAMTGDGINDGPALKAADLGVAMGEAGTDVARSVADVVLEDDKLQTMVVAVSQGRTIYGNIRKTLRFLLSTNATEIELMLAAVALRLGQPLNPMQLLWINLISDIFPGLALALEPAEPDVLERPPRKPDLPIISRRDLRIVFGESAVITGGALASYLYALSRYGAGPRAATHAFTAISLAELVHAWSCRSETHTLFDKDVLPANHYLDVALGGSLLAQLLTVLVPGLRRLLGTTPLGLTDSLVVGLSATMPLLINEAMKKARRGRQESADGGDVGVKSLSKRTSRKAKHRKGKAKSKHVDQKKQHHGREREAASAAS